MVDLEKLRIWDDPGETLCAEAADEIERLRGLVRDAASDFEDCDLPSIGARYRRALDQQSEG